MTTDRTPNDPRFLELYGMQNAGQTKREYRAIESKRIADLHFQWLHDKTGSLWPIADLDAAEFR